MRTKDQELSLWINGNLGKATATTAEQKQKSLLMRERAVERMWLEIKPVLNRAETGQQAADRVLAWLNTP